MKVVNDLLNYKKHKTILKELNLLVPLLEKQLNELDNYKKYTLVKQLINNLKDTKSVLEIHRNNFKSKLEG